MRSQLLGVYRALRRAQGPQDWWPARTPFEVVVGAVLTQNTAWRNVERALSNLRRARLLAARPILRTPPCRLRRLLVPAGTFRVKEKRLRAVVGWWVTRGSRVRRSRRRDPEAIREELLAVHGVGPETADSILLYAIGEPSFVVDAYARRIFRRLGLVPAHLGYEETRAFFEHNLPRDLELWNDFHAQIVRLGATRCRPKPRCGACPLAGGCRVPRGAPP